jgi:UDP-N-acetylmuramate dehydrogenase
MHAATFDTESAYNELRPHFRGRVRRQEPLARHCAFGVGGPADVWVSVETKKELMGLVSLCAEQRWPVLIVGNSTNVVYADAGVRGIVARISLSDYRIEEQSDNSALLHVEAGVSWPRLMHELAPLGWGGLEFGVGIPGTLGGAVISNAGAHNSDLGRVLEWIEVLDARGCNSAGEGETSYPLVRRYLHDELDLSYRHSRFREQRQVRFNERGQLIPASRSMIEPPEIVMLLGIHLHREDPQKLRALITEHKQYRRQVEPPQRHAGTIFKDPPAHEAAKLIEQAGLKGKVHGKAQISERNANYIVNLGGASAADIAALIVEAHQRVLEQFGMNLELDVELRGAWQ